MKTNTTIVLTPTLWRTCRALAGPTRLNLLRRIIEKPDQCVTDLAAAEEVSESRASQELRRLQSRGLVQMYRTGTWTRYRPVTDPKVVSAKPLLAAMRKALVRWSDEKTRRVAHAFGHERRLKLVQLMQEGRRSLDEFQEQGNLSRPALFRHIAVLQEGGVIQRVPGGWELRANPHPLAKAMLALLRTT
ncbi:MAG: helix-turn-helix domain-containing protein [Kiritimatiellae bacterium]|jgi:DNA-binding transcriptional ArsR family regulator|nr:helix-turn-helix domain-containing protein [Kiritimatiellia bacterium]MDY0149103.1 helix-turn-helix domain-containing protein [Kiritimatiellia bacterium]